MNRLLELLAAEALEKQLNVFHIAVTDDAQRTEEAHIRSANPCQDVYSSAKAFTATAVGILCDRGLMTLEDRVTDILAPFVVADMDEKWKRMTVRHLLTHRCGFEGSYLDIDKYDRKDFGTDDFLGYLFRTPLIFAPGEAYSYSDAAYYVLSRIVSQVSGMGLDDFLWKEVFSPLGVREAAWSKCPMGYAMGATGLYIRAADVAKLASCYVFGGKYFDRKLFSEAWVREACGGCAFVSDESGLFYFKSGMRGQMMLFSPEKRISVAWTAYEKNCQPLVMCVRRYLAEN